MRGDLLRSSNHERLEDYGQNKVQEKFSLPNSQSSSVSFFEVSA